MISNLRKIAQWKRTLKQVFVPSYNLDDEKYSSMIKSTAKSRPILTPTYGNNFFLNRQLPPGCLLKTVLKLQGEKKIKTLVKSLSSIFGIMQYSF